MSFSGAPSPFGASDAGASSRGPTDRIISATDVNFEIFDWYPAYQNCLQFFLNHAQHEHHVQALCAFTNICLPFQWAQPVMNYSAVSPNLHAQSPAPRDPHYHYPSSSSSFPRGGGGGGVSSALPPPLSPVMPPSHFVSLIPYIKRLIVTGFDHVAVLHGFFGDCWRKGIGTLWEVERRNYLFAAKSVGWARVKNYYDMSPQESVPFIKPLQNVELREIEQAERMWSDWLAMEDWMIGPRAPDTMSESVGAGPSGDNTAAGDL